MLNSMCYTTAKTLCCVGMCSNGATYKNPVTTGYMIGYSYTGLIKRNQFISAIFKKWFSFCTSANVWTIFLF